MIQRRVVVALAGVALALLVTAVMFLLTGPGDESPVREPAPAPRTSIATPTPSPPPEVSTATPTPQPTANDETVEAGLVYIFTAPSSVVFQEVGESITLEVRGRLSDGDEVAIPSGPASSVTFSSSDPSVANIDAVGRLTAHAPGSTEISVEFDEFTTTTVTIVYAELVEIPPYDPNKVARLPSGAAFVVNRVIVAPVGDAYDPALTRAIASTVGGSVIADFRNLNAFVIELPSDTVRDLFSALFLLNSDSRVAAFQLNTLYESSQSTSSATYAYHHSNVSEAWSLLHERGTARAIHHVHVAIIDSNLAVSHSDPDRQSIINSEFSLMNLIALQVREEDVISASSSISGESHGLSVASVIAGRDRVPGVVGSSPNVPYTLHAYNANSPEGLDPAKVLRALDHIVKHQQAIDVINLSAGFNCNYDDPAFSKWVPFGTQLGIRSLIAGGRLLCSLVVDYFPDDSDDPDRRNIFDKLEQTRTLFVVSAGNEAADDETERYPSYPQRWSRRYDNMIAVGGLDHAAHIVVGAGGPGVGTMEFVPDRWCHSNYGNGITLAAEGAAIYTIDFWEREGAHEPRTWYGPLSGTSFSAPLVTSVVLLLRAVDPSLPARDIVNIMLDTADEIAVDRRPRPEDCGAAPPSIWKRVNAGRAVARAIQISEQRVLEAVQRAEIIGGAEVDATPTPSRINTSAPEFTPTQSPATAPPPGPTRAPVMGLRLTAISAGADHNCGLRAEGTLVCWGRNDHGQASPPEGTFVSVSSAGNHSCAIDLSGAVRCWGQVGGAAAASAQGSFVSVSAGDTHACAIQEGGSLQCWGPADGIWNPSDSPTGPFTAISAGSRRTCGVQADGTLGCWGRTLPSDAPPPGTFTSVSVFGSVFGSDHCAIRTDGSAVCWGTEGVGLTDPPDGPFDSVGAGPDRACGIRADRSAICWGTGTSDPLLEPEGLFASITLGQKHYCGLRPDGTVVCWGNNDHGQSIPPDPSFTSAHPGDGYFCGRRADGSVACRTSDDPEFGSSTLRFVPSASFVDVSSAAHWSCGVRTSGQLACWGRTADTGRLGPPPAGSFRKVSISFDHACALAADGSIACWGSNFAGKASAPPGSFESVHVGFDYSCGLRADGAAVCWGNAIEGDAAVIEGTFTSIDVGGIIGCGLRPDGEIECWHGGSVLSGREADPANPFTSIAVGSGLVCALHHDGTPSCWATDDQQAPLSAPPGPFVFIEAHSEGTHVCGVRPDGSVKCWVAAP